jgi:uncharacterized membrane protein YheB (UPF0754 family)
VDRKLPGQRHAVIPFLQNWSQIRADVDANWYIYLSMPLIAAAIGYLTKLAALEMLYRPLEFVGVGKLGWQGLVPRRAGKVAATTIELLTENILKPEELLDGITAQEAFEDLRGPLESIIEATAQDIAEAIWPGLWTSLPAPARALAMRRARSRAPKIIDNLLDQMRNDLAPVIDVHYLAVSTLVKNKKKLTALMRETTGGAMAFVRRSGIYFGLIIGLVQMVAWAVIHNVWIMPVFGLVTGFVSDYVALTMLFAPRYPRRILGIRLHGVLHAQRDEITRNYARIIADDIFSPEALIHEVLAGPGSDRLMTMVRNEIIAAIDAEAGIVLPVVNLVVGTERYRAIKEAIAARAAALTPAMMGSMGDYADRTIDLEQTLIDKMGQLTNEQFESIMRPIFKDDEPLMVTVGAVLGFLVGELQVEMVTQLSR